MSSFRPRAKHEMCKAEARVWKRAVAIAIPVSLAAGISVALALRPSGLLLAMFVAAYVFALMLHIMLGLALWGIAELYAVRDGVKVFKLKNSEECETNAYTVSILKRVVVWGI